MSVTDTYQPTPDTGGPAQPLIRVTGLQKYFPIRGGILGRTQAKVQAVDGVSFEVKKGETLGIVGESGCGKSTTAKLLIGLVEKDKGEIVFDGHALGERLSLKDLRRGVQMVFQDSYATLNPRLTILDSVAFGAKVQGLDNPEELARKMMDRVGLDPDRFAHRYPHELSGGQRQRVNIARALAMSPRLVVLDEAVSALDKSVEAQVLNLLNDLRAEFGLTYVFISHDLNVVRYISDRILVMYLGEVVEVAPVDSIWQEQAHPYTRSLFSAMPSMDPDNRTKEPPLAGDPPNPINPPSGCRFHTRCRFASAVCKEAVPKLSGLARNGDHMVACHLHDAQSGHPKAGQGVPE
ncbi:peptide ABC transporter ATP-binding protein [Antarctobacter heliothermus]|uniref:Glutathione import ATP-binding protein GsiA n=1 Tax=Antarctobacter heliothermus TaxID=74033 RepID=A0A222E230_9RHOB|nr:ABC transporter ATP-binding protein [Antarctobacter heliothermus]ASP20236.1 peptide ABC transporter ATP-binding protein [Antarctobacter heliothermus]MBT54671.1 ABC transporter ATP-binding protein [Mameliella sp.]|tara:strand:+ start:264 stop:1313 length:1050 start_codon:yes stop_codon:yes gene_type:complete